MCVIHIVFVSAFVFTQRPGWKQGGFPCHLPEPLSRLFWGPHLLRVQASRIPAELKSTCSSFLPLGGQGLSPLALHGLYSANAWPLGLSPFQYPPPQSSCCISSLTPLLFCSLLIWKTDILFTTYSEQKGSQHLTSKWVPQEHVVTEGTWKPDFYPSWKALFQDTAGEGNTSVSFPKGLPPHGAGAGQGHAMSVVVVYCYQEHTKSHFTMYFTYIWSHLILLPAPWHRYCYRH